MNRFAAALVLCLFCVTAASQAALATRPTQQDRAWIDKCVAERKNDRLAGAKMPRHTPAQLRKYCACMQRIVEDNQPFTIPELERSYPPAHAMCLRQGEKITAKRKRLRGAR